MTQNNVVEFPKSKIVRDIPHNLEKIEEMKKNSLQNFADSICSNVSDTVIGELSEYGIDVTDDNFIRDFIFMNAILSAAIYRSVGLEHDLHEFIDEQVNIQKIEPDEEPDEKT